MVNLSPQRAHVWPHRGHNMATERPPLKPRPLGAQMKATTSPHCAHNWTICGQMVTRAGSNACQQKRHRGMVNGAVSRGRRQWELGAPLAVEAAQDSRRELLLRQSHLASVKALVLGPPRLVTPSGRTGDHPIPLREAEQSPMGLEEAEQTGSMETAQTPRGSGIADSR